jgi:hypothetical protein
MAKLQLNWISRVHAILYKLTGSGVESALFPI